MDNIQTIRSDAIRARLAVGKALCAIAESEVRSGHKNRAQESLLTIHRTLTEVAILLAQPNHVSASAAQQLAEFITTLTDRAQDIERIVTEMP